MIFHLSGAQGCQSKTAIREVEDIKVIKKDNLIIIEIQANAFLLHMVRIIVGTLLMVAKRELDPEDVRTILNKKIENCWQDSKSFWSLFFGT